MGPAALLALLLVTHSRSEGRSRFALEESGRVAVSITVGEADLPELCDVDLSLRDRPAQEEKLGACLERALPERLRLRGDGQACPCMFDRYDRERGTVRLTAHALCAALPRVLQVDWGLFAGSPLDHVSVATFLQPRGKPRMTLLSKRASRFSLDVERPLLPWLLGLAGALALVAGVSARAWRRRRGARAPR